MSFKRTSCISVETKSRNEVTLDTNLVSPVQSPSKVTSPVDNDDVAVATFACYSKATDSQLQTLKPAPTSSHLPVPESNYDEYAEEPELVGRAFFLRENKDIVGPLEKQSPLFYDNNSSTLLLDLQSENLYGKEAAAADDKNDDEKKFTQKKSTGGCIICHQLEQAISTQDDKISELTQKHQDLGQKLKKFIVSNCQLNEEIDRLKLEVARITLENSRLRDENIDLTRSLALRVSQPPSRERIRSTPASFEDSEISHPEQGNSEKAFSPSIRKDIKEAILLSREQHQYVRKLQQQTYWQNHAIKVLHSRLQKKDTSRKENKPSVKLSEKKTILPKNILASQLSIAEDYGGDKVAAEVCTKNDLYRQETAHFDTSPRKSGAELGQEMHLGPSAGSPQRHGRVLEKTDWRSRPEHFDRMLISRDVVMPKNITLEANAEGVMIPSAVREETASRPDHVLQTEMVSCPLCSKEFSANGKNFQMCFEKHINECLSSTERQCPMCFMEFPSSVSQRDYEKHVDEHFLPDFEVIEPQINHP